jgi:hypothetical protein
MNDIQNIMAAAEEAWQERTADLGDPPSTTRPEFIAAFVLGATWQVKADLTRRGVNT